jgi:hypothetical protein
VNVFLNIRFRPCIVRFLLKSNYDLEEGEEKLLGEGTSFLGGSGLPTTIRVWGTTLVHQRLLRFTIAKLSLSVPIWVEGAHSIWERKYLLLG